MRDIVEQIFHKHENSVREVIIEYLNLLFKHHETDNIISSEDTDYFIKREIYDSYRLNNLLLGNEFSDIGTGGGIPGVLIAILNPGKKIYLVDRKQSYTDFLLFIISKLKLKNVTVIKTDILKMPQSICTSNVILKNFSNKFISKMDYSSKFIYIMQTLFTNKTVKKVYMLTGSPVLQLDRSILDGFQIKTKEILSPYFNTKRVVAEVKLEGIINS